MNFDKLVESVMSPSTLKLIIIRGLSGSGKTTYGKKLIAVDPTLSHYEADMYFYNSDGKYIFNPKLLPKAHAWCKDQVERDLSNNKSVIVSNTFTQNWELAPYVELGNKYGAEIVIKKAIGNYKNVHGVPEEALAKMKSRWEDVDGENPL